MWVVPPLKRGLYHVTLTSTFGDAPLNLVGSLQSSAPLIYGSALYYLGKGFNIWMPPFGGVFNFSKGLNH